MVPWAIRQSSSARDVVPNLTSQPPEKVNGYGYIKGDELDVEAEAMRIETPRLSGHTNLLLG